MADLKKEIQQQVLRRRTFAIISHPDAGKTTMTEKLLLYGGAINMAGSVKARKAKKHALSDWMEIEKQRGISVTSSVMQFEYNNHCINILDTPDIRTSVKIPTGHWLLPIVQLCLSTVQRELKLKQLNCFMFVKCADTYIYIYK